MSAELCFGKKRLVGGVKEARLVAHKLTDALLLFVALQPAVSGSVGNLSPSLFLNPTALSHHVGAQ